MPQEAGSGAEPVATVRMGDFVGTLAELLAALEAGAVAPAALSLQDLLPQTPLEGGDLERALEAFVALAQLVERKARALLPVAPDAEDDDGEAPWDEQEEAQALAERLAAYEAFAEAAAALRNFELRRAERFGRPAADATARARVAAAAPAAAPAEDLDRLLRVFAEVWERAQPRTREVRRERWTVPAAVRALRQRLAAAGSAEFGELFAADADRLQVVVTFLALLELVREGSVWVQQEGPFAPLRIRWRGQALGEDSGGR
jgi:segregation and condensation protein A